jgi:lysophospholipase L1-like esterase
MIDCMVLGDSIAVGLHDVRKECIMYAKSGWNSKHWNDVYLNNDLEASNVIISLGSNDLKNIDTREQLEKLRAKVKGKRVYWILPAIKPHVREIVIDISNSYSDMVIPITTLSKDGVHPTYRGYQELAFKTKTWY